MPASRSAAITIHPATPARWADLEQLFGPRGACGGCWCMVWRRSRKEWESGKGDGNRKALKTIVERGDKPGVIAYAGGEPVGWCSVAPRTEFPALGRSRVLAPVDDAAVWSITCLYVAKPHRRRGLSVKLIEAAVALAAKGGATIVEGYPIVPYQDEVPPVFAWTGLASAYESAGFTVAVRRSKARPVMRKTCAKRTRR